MISSIMNKVMLTLALLSIGFMLLCFGAMNLMAQMNDDLQYDHSGSTYIPGNASHDPFVANTDYTGTYCCP